MTARRVVIGLGTSARGDDAVGLHVARKVAAAAPAGVVVIIAPGDPLALLDRWDAEDEVVLVDAAASLGMPGRVHRLDPVAAPLPPDLRMASTHAFGFAATVELARVLGRLPARLTIFAIEGATFAVGAALSPAVARAADALAARIVAGCARARRNVPEPADH